MIVNGAACLTGMETRDMLVIDPPTKPDVDAPPEPRKKKRATDPTLVLCSRLDRAFDQLPDWGRAMVLAYLKGKWEQKQ